MKKLLRIVFCLFLTTKFLCNAYTLTLNVQNNVWISAAWQGANTTVASAFSGSGLPADSTVAVWNVTNQGWDVSNYIGSGVWDAPNLAINNTDGFLVYGGTTATVTVNGSNMSGSSVTRTLAPNKYYFLGFAYPRAGNLERPPSPYNAGENLNFPGRTKTNTNNVEEEYYRWDISTQGFIFTRRASDGDPDNATGGCSTGAYGARWRTPGATSGYQGNGYAQQWVNVGEPILFLHQTKVGGVFINRTWTMPLSNCY